MVQWLRFNVSTAGGTGSIPFGELRPHMPRGAAKKGKNNIVAHVKERDFVHTWSLYYRQGERKLRGN